MKNMQLTTRQQMLCEKTSKEISSNGFSVKKNMLPITELNALREMILSNINLIYNVNDLPELHDWKDLIDQYRSIGDERHSLLSSKTRRLLTEEQIERLDRLRFFNNLKGLIGNFMVTDEEAIGYPEVYWRIVRPNAHSDIGPMHADGWFWDLNDSWRGDFYKNRLKVWIPIETENSKNGLKVVQGSHHTNFEYTINNLNGKKKPLIKNFLREEEINLLKMDTTDLVIFHDRLLHGGALNKASTVRVSLEFTCSIYDENI